VISMKVSNRCFPSNHLLKSIERKRELRELVESSKAQLEEIRNQQQSAEETAIIAKAELERTQKELERALPFEKEVKEKNLQIGKLRHEGVILNDHLTKALRFIKQKNPEDMVDRLDFQTFSKYLLLIFIIAKSSRITSFTF
jgi:hypothetical protein